MGGNGNPDRDNQSPRLSAKLRQIARDAKREIAVYRLALADARTPLPAKLALGLAVGYLLLPFDLIPDFIPVIGQLDDLLIVPGLILIARRLIPPEVLADCRTRVAETA